MSNWPGLPVNKTAHQEEHLGEFSNDNSVGLNEMLVSAILCCLSELMRGAQRGENKCLSSKIRKKQP